MTREQVEKYLNKKVKVQLFDNDVIEGYLRKTGDDDFKNNPNLYLPRNYYFMVNDEPDCVSYLFRSSHVKKIQILREENW